MIEYLRNWGLYLRGLRWLWTQRIDPTDPLRSQIAGATILYKPNFGPWKFLPIYLTTYLAGTLFGCGVVSLSRWWADRSEFVRSVRGQEFDQWFFVPTHPFSRFMTRQLDRVFDTQHGALAGPRLWGSTDLWSK